MKMKIRINFKGTLTKILASFKGVLVFIKEVWLQIKKISWPSFKESLKYTAIVLVFAVLTAIFLGGADFGFTSLLKKFILK